MQTAIEHSSAYVHSSLDRYSLIEQSLCSEILIEHSLISLIKMFLFFFFYEKQINDISDKIKQYIINKNKLSYIWASATCTAIGASAMGQCKLDLAPRMHIIADLNKEKLNLHLSHPITIP